MTEFMEFVHANFALVNLPYTMFLALILLYWFTVVLGMLDLSLLDFDLDLDLDADADVDVDADVDADLAGGGWLQILTFFNVGHVPVMVILSILALSMWAISMLGNNYLQSHSLLVAGLIFVPNFIASLFVAKILTQPLRGIFRQLAKEEQQVKVVGSSCVITTSEVTAEFGEAEVTSGGAPIRIQVRPRESETFARGEEALVFDHDLDAHVYRICKLKLEKEV